MQLNIPTQKATLNSISDLYNYLEQVDSFKCYDSISSVVKKLVSETNDESTKMKLKCEKIFFDFAIKGGKVKPSVQFGDGFEYPTFELFDEETYQYLISRSSETSNPFVKIRYNQILWNSPSKHKHESYGKNIIDDSLQFFEQNGFSSQKGIISLLENAIYLSERLSYKQQDLKDAVKKILFDTEDVPIGEKYYLISLMTQNRKLFKKEDFEGVLDLCDHIIQEYRQKNHLDMGNRTAEVAEKIASKLSMDGKKWKEEIAKNYEHAANYRIKDIGNGIPLSFLAQAQNYYKEAKNDKKVKEIGVRYKDLSKKLALNRVSIPFENELTELLNKYTDCKIEAILEREPYEIFEYLAHAPDVIPNYDIVKKSSEKSKRNGFRDLLKTIKFDKNLNIQSNGSKNETQEIFSTYDFFANYNLQFLSIIFFNGVKHGRIDYASFIDYIKNNSWLAVDIEAHKADGNTLEYNWLNLITPAIFDYFLRLDAAIQSDNLEVNFMLSIDSLTLKIEGILRDLAQMRDINTIVPTRGGGTREMFIDDLLAQPKLKELLGDDNVAFIKFALTSVGLNLRNNVAHCFLKDPRNYTFGYMNILITIILRLSIFEIKMKDTIN